MFVKSVIKIFLMLALLWLAGLVLFMSALDMKDMVPEEYDALRGDGIVVLTGGNMRVAQGLAMLKDNKGKELLISGVDKDITLAEILNAYSAKVAMASNLSRITLGYQAQNTKNNATEAYHWAQERDFESLIIVTAHYHMPRAMLHFKRHMPSSQDYELIAKSVIPEEFRRDSWWKNSQLIKLLVKEYNKYIITYLSF